MIVECSLVLLTVIYKSECQAYHNIEALEMGVLLHLRQIKILTNTGRKLLTDAHLSTSIYTKLETLAIQIREPVTRYIMMLILRLTNDTYSSEEASVGLELENVRKLNGIHHIDWYLDA